MSLEVQAPRAGAPFWVSGLGNEQEPPATTVFTKSWLDLPAEVRADFARIGVGEEQYRWENGTLAVDIGMIGLADRARVAVLLRLFNFLQRDGSGVDAMNVRTGPLTHAGLAARVPGRAENGHEFLGMSGIRLEDEWALEAYRPAMLLQWWRGARKPESSARNHRLLVQGCRRFSLPGDTWRHALSRNPLAPVLHISAAMRETPSVFCWRNANAWTSLTSTRIAGADCVSVDFFAMERVAFSRTQEIVEVNGHAFWAPHAIKWKIAALLGLVLMA